MEGTPPPRAGTPDYFDYNDTYGHGTHTAGIIGAVSCVAGPGRLCLQPGLQETPGCAMLACPPSSTDRTPGASCSFWADGCPTSPLASAKHTLPPCPSCLLNPGWQQRTGHCRPQLAGQAASVPLHLERWQRLRVGRHELHQVVPPGGRHDHLQLMGRHWLLKCARLGCCAC